MRVQRSVVGIVLKFVTGFSGLVVSLLSFHKHFSARVISVPKKIYIYIVAPLPFFLILFARQKITYLLPTRTALRTYLWCTASEIRIIVLFMCSIDYAFCWGIYAARRVSLF